MDRQTLEQLVNQGDSRWPEIQSWIAGAKNKVDVLPAADPYRGEALVAAQLPTRAPLGAVIYETGGILIDDGWLRILGSGHALLPRSINGWNRAAGIELGGGAPFVLVADDVVGGFYAMDGGMLGHRGNIFYFAPDVLRWEDLGKTYGEFLSWCFTGNLAKYYLNFRWPGWREEVGMLKGDQGISINPPLCAQGPQVEKRQRGPMAQIELYRHYVVEFPKQMRAQQNRP